VVAHRHYASGEIGFLHESFTIAAKLAEHLLEDGDGQADEVAARRLQHPQLQLAPLDAVAARDAAVGKQRLERLDRQLRERVVAAAGAGGALADGGLELSSVKPAAGRAVRPDRRRHDLELRRPQVVQPPARRGSGCRCCRACADPSAQAPQGGARVAPALDWVRAPADRAADLPVRLRRRLLHPVELHEAQRAQRVAAGQQGHPIGVEAG